MDPKRFEWDAHNIGHIGEHGVGVNEVEEAFGDPLPFITGSGPVKGEWRIHFVGMTAGGRILEVVFTPRGRRNRVVTAYDAAGYELREYLRRKGAR